MTLICWRVLIIVMALTSVPHAAWAGDPLERDRGRPIGETRWRYTTPSGNYIGFKNRDYLSAHPGHLHYKNWLFTTMEVESMGINFLPWRWDAGSYTNATSLTFALAGYRITMPHLVLYGAFKGGLFYTRDIKDSDGITHPAGGEQSLFFLGTELGLRLDVWRMWFQLRVSAVGAGLHALSTAMLELGMRISDRWKLGLRTEYADRGLSLCDGDEAACAFDFSLSYTALWVAWRPRKTLWIKVGVVLFSSFSVGTPESLNVIERDFTSLFISFE